MTCAALFWITSNGVDYSEADDHFQVARQLLSAGRLGFDQDMPGIFTKAPCGITYASHEIGNTLLNLPLAALCEWLGRGNDKRIALLGQVLRTFQAGLVMALTIGAGFLIMVRHLQVQQRLAAISWLLVAVSSFMLCYAHDGFDGCFCALLWMLALLWHLNYLQTSEKKMLVLSMLAGGAAVITRISMVLPVALLAAVSALNGGGWRDFRKVFSRCAVMLMTLLPFALWQMGYNHLRTGSVWTSPVQTLQYQENNGLDGSLLIGVTGLLLSPGKSLFLFAPLLVPALAGWLPAWRRQPWLVWHLCGALLLWLLLHGKMRNWHAAWSWGPRYFITLLPLLLLPLPLVLREWWAVRWRRVLLAGLFAWGVVLQGAGVVANYHYRYRYAYEHGWLIGDDFVWNAKRNQVTDQLSSAWRNVSVMRGRLPPEIVSGAEPIGIRAANTLNHWAVRAWLAGTSRPLIWLALAANAGLLGFSLWKLHQSCAATAGQADAAPATLS